MESTPAATLQKKKINKGKLKKTIKNVLCRPDTVFWPSVTEEQKDMVETILTKYRVQIPEFQKPLWKDLKSLPKEKRPKPPKIKKVEGLLFGLLECSNTVSARKCSGVIIEATVNPRSIVQPLLESCSDKRVPVVCVEGLRKATKLNFGIPTSCFGVQKDYLTEISKIISDLGGAKLPETKVEFHKDIKMSDDKQHLSLMDTQEPITFEYLYRANKKSRVFIPPSEETLKKEDKKFKGQDFIEFSDKVEQNEKLFKNMMVKRIASNPNRVKAKRNKIVNS